MKLFKRNRALQLKSGDIVTVRPLSEIRATLDASGCYEGVPFMAEMERYCGKTYRVHKRADKVCVELDAMLDFRRMRDAVFLEEVRCDGAAHDGCQKLCLIFWKEAWLQRAPKRARPEPHINWADAFVTAASGPIDPDKVYTCQSTALYAATEPIEAWDPRQYLRDLRSGALNLKELAQVLFVEVYDRVAKRRNRRPLGGIFGPNTTTPTASLGLAPGELVQVRKKEDILATLDKQGKNRGMYFSLDMTRVCGQELRVITPVNRMILENNGKMKAMKHTVVLQGAECSGLCNRGCARAGHPLWREVWLDRVGEQGAAVPKRAP